MPTTVTTTVRLPLSAKRRLAAAARRRGLSLSQYLVEAAERESDRPKPLRVSPTAYEIARLVRPENTIPAGL